MDKLLQDLRYALRMLAKSPGFTLVAVASLALGIGANAAMFSVVDATLLRPLPYPDPERIVVPVITVTHTAPDRAGVDTFPWSSPKYQVMRGATRNLFADVAGFGDRRVNLSGGGEPERVGMEFASAPYFRILGVRPALGRTFAAEEDSVPGAHAVALVSHELWTRRFGGDPGLVGRTITLEKTPFTVVGILPRGFRGLSGNGEVWVPMAMAPRLFWPSVFQEPFAHWHQAVARLRPGITPDQARRAMAGVAARVEEAYPTPPRFVAPGDRAGATIVGLRDARSDPLLRRAVLVLLGAVGFVLLIACANVANLLLARAAARRREVSIRLAVGAGRGRLVRQLLTESVVLALLGGAFGVLLALWATDVLSALRPERMAAWGIRGTEALELGGLGLDGRVLAFTLAVSLLAGLLFGLAPALHASRPDVAGMLKEGAGASAPAAASLRRLGGRGMLVSAEVALALVLLAGAGLMLRSFARLRAVDPGFSEQKVLTVSVAPREADYPEPDDAVALHARLLERFAALPGVRSVTVDKCAPLSGGCNGTLIMQADEKVFGPGEGPRTTVHWAGPDHFRTLGIRLLEGRSFTPQDRRGSPRVVVVSRALAEKLWPGRSAVGRRVRPGMGDVDEPAEVVGVVEDVRYGGLHDEPGPALYLADLQATWPEATFLLRTAGDPLALTAAVRREVRAVDPDLPVFDVKTMRERVADATSRDRFGAALLSAFAALALVLAAMGIHAVIAYSVARRTRELGVRQALGASPGDLVRLVVGQGAALTGVGVVAGMAAALALTRVLSGLLYEVEPTDPATLAAITLFLAGTALLAAWLPARRAARVDPMVALRSE